ncbi:probable serine carboxypeptidase CPVL [Eriocheir sinensis]|uniref:probable serine carboxypeptidase CPVL n=1 Tax=Eriocheir sinensis TaxID=95602 RepID=UPI0021CAA64A|nr:probable serine carboxypeptidase CPVL [Eriocheir sinensis]
MWVAVVVPVVVVVLSALVNDPLGLLYSRPEVPTTTISAPSQPKEDVGEPLFLTPLLEVGRIEEARRLSRVPLGEEYGLSYAGFFSVDKAFDAHHFIWFFPAREAWEAAPVMVWLDGGPGLSSMLSLFSMHGPFSLTRECELVPRQHTLTKVINVIYIDNPVGAGYSFTSTEDSIPRDQVKVGGQALASLTQVLQMFPEISDNNLYIAGHSYAGKFVPALAHAIHTHNFEALHKIQLKGIGLGNSLVESESVINYGDMLYATGMVDEKERRHFKAQSEKAKSLVRQAKLEEAHLVVGGLMGTHHGASHYEQLTGVTNTLNFMDDCSSIEEMHYMDHCVILPIFRRALHVGNKTFHQPFYLGKFFKADVFRSTKPWIEEMMNNSVKVLMYNGQLDLSVPYASTERLARTLHWPHKEEYMRAPRRAWKVEGQVAGYVKEARGLVRVLVRKASHTVGHRRPHWMLDMFSRFMTRDTFL